MEPIPELHASETSAAATTVLTAPAVGIAPLDIAGLWKSVKPVLASQLAICDVASAALTVEGLHDAPLPEDIVIRVQTHLDNDAAAELWRAMCDALYQWRFGLPADEQALAMRFCLDLDWNANDALCPEVAHRARSCAHGGGAGASGIPRRHQPHLLRRVHPGQGLRAR